MNIYEKMSAITMEIETVAKNLKVDTGKGKGYKAVSEVDILKAVKPIEEKHKVYSYPVNRRLVDSGTMTSKTQYGDTQRLFMRIETTYRFVNVEEPSEYIEVITYGDGVDSQDKACGKAMTYADKYALMKAYKIQTGDDPDVFASEDLVSMTDEATEAEKKVFMDLCEAKGVDPVAILQECGWEKGKMTKAQHGMAMRKLEKLK